MLRAIENYGNNCVGVFKTGMTYAYHKVVAYFKLVEC